MKSKLLYLPLVMVIIFLSACMGETAELPVEGLDFSEEEAIDVTGEQGFDFEDDEGLTVGAEEGFDFSEEEAESPGEMVFDEEDAVDVTSGTNELYPPDGTSVWMLNHDEAIATCSTGTFVMNGPESERVEINLGAEGASLVISELYSGYEVFYVIETVGVGGSTYSGYFLNPEGGNEIFYKITFTSLVDEENADYLIGSLRSEIEECVMTRAFDGNRLDE